MSATTAQRAPSKSATTASIAATAGLTKPQVAAVLNTLTAEAGRCLGSDGPGVFVLPGLLKFVRSDMPAKPARTGVKNPFKPGEIMDVPAKPATSRIKVRALKNLKVVAAGE